MNYKRKYHIEDIKLINNIDILNAVNLIKINKAPGFDYIADNLIDNLDSKNNKYILEMIT